MIISSGKLKQSVILIVVITVVAALLAIYFLFYIDTKEEDINRRNFKVLSKSAQNIRQKIFEYSSNRVTQNYLTYNLDYILSSRPDLCDQDDSLKLHLKYEIEVMDKHELVLDSLKKATVKEQNVDKTQKSLQKNGTIEFTDQTLKFVFRDILTSSVDDAAACEKCNCNSKRALKYSAKSSILVSQFLNPLLHHDIFTEYVILRPGKPNNESVVYESRSLGSIDSLKAAAQSPRIDVTLSGVSYMVFRFPFTVENDDWVLIGLQDSESYLKEARSFDLSLLYTILLTALTLLLSLPLIKVVLISRNEKLNKADVVLCGISLLSGCFFWTIIISQWDYDHLYKEDIQQNNILLALSDTIEARFIKEIDSAYNEMKRAESIPIKHDLVNLGSSTSLNSYRPNYRTFDVISWIDSTGMQLQKWATNYKATKKINVSKRSYFTHVRNKLEWRKGRDQKIVIESIISWNNAEHLAVISKASGDSFPMVAMTTPLPSVINCTLPQGYKFCIADQQGSVWFHSDTNKNLSENIFEECGITPTINDFLYKGGENSIVIYENRKHQINIKPMKDLPLYLVALKDLSIENQSKVYVLQVTFVLLIIYIFIIILAVLIITLTWKRSLKRHITVRSLDWIKPDEDRIKLYFSIGLLNVGIAVLLLLFAALLSPANEIVILLLTPLYVLPVYFLSLNNQEIHEFFKPLNSTLLSTISLVIVVLNASFFVKFDASPGVLIYQLLVISLIICWLIFNRHLKEKFFFVRIFKKLQLNKRFFKSFSLRTSYGLAFSSLCFILGVIPVFQFHRHAFNLERVKNAMAIQYNLVKEASEKPKHSRRVYLISGMDTISCKNEEHASPENFRDFEKLTKFVSPVIDTSRIGFIKQGGLFYTYVNDRRWSWGADHQGRLCFTSTDIGEDGHKSTLRSALQKYQTPQTIGWTVGILGLIFLFVASRYLTGRIFIFDVNRNLVEADLFIVRAENKKTTIADRELLLEPLLNNHLFIIGLPFSGERDYVDKLHPPEKHKRLLVDLIEVSNGEQWNTVVSEKAANEKYEIIIVDHFEYDFQNQTCNNSKLVLMEKLFLMWKKKIVILSTIHPSQFLECYGEDTKLKERWNTIFSHFYNIYYPLQKERLSKASIMQEYKIDGKKWQRNEHYYEFIERECSHGLFLQNLKPALYSLVDIANKNNLTIEELSDKVKSLSYTYYASIWASCSKDERFLIYDLAEDGLVNVKNDESIIQLIYKGIFIQKRTLTIMNRSFRNFVLSYVNPGEVLEMRKETLSYGTWSRLKGPILFILIIAILFLLYTQKGFSNQVMGFLTSIAAGIPLILKLLTLIESPSKPKDKPAS